MRSMRKALVFGAGLLAGVVLMFVSQNMMAVQARATAENFSQFLEQVQRDKIKEVTYTGGSEEIRHDCTASRVRVRRADAEAHRARRRCEGQRTTVNDAGVATRHRHDPFGGV